MKVLFLALAQTVFAAAVPPPPPPAQADILVTVEGVPIRRSEAMDRAWKQFGTQIINLMADEIIVKKALDAQKVKADPKEVDARLKRIQEQFKDQATFEERLKASGSSLAALKADIEGQVAREALVVKVKSITVTDPEVKEYFDANKDKLASPEAVRLRHILVASEKEANDFLVALRAGADFAKLASQVSLDASTKDKGGEVGFAPRGVLQPEIEKLVFGLKPGEIGGPVRTQAGFLLFKAEESRAAKPAVFAEIQKDLKQAIFTDKVTKAWQAYLGELREKAKYETQPQAPPR